MGRLDGRVALITGAGAGIGAAMARAFVAEGARVGVLDISGQEKDVATELGEAALPLHGDVADAETVCNAVSTVVERFGRLDIVCNNAGIDGEVAPTAEYDLENFERVMAVNSTGVFLGMRYAIPELIRHGGGSIINTSSIAASVAFPRMVAYCAAKAAVLQMTKVAAVEYAGAGVRVNAICPGVVETANLREMTPETIAGVTAMTPQARIADPREIASVAMFLAGDESSFMTGTAVTPDGGYTAL